MAARALFAVAPIHVELALVDPAVRTRMLVCAPIVRLRAVADAVQAHPVD